jgi:hypothetical protein
MIVGEEYLQSPRNSTEGAGKDELDALANNDFC